MLDILFIAGRLVGSVALLVGLISLLVPLRFLGIRNRLQAMVLSVGAAMLIAVITIVGEDQPSSVDPPAAVDVKTESAVTFTVVDEKIYDTPLKAQIEQHIVVVSAPTKKELQAEILRRYEAVKNLKTFRHYPSPTNIYIYVYGSKEQALAGQGLWIGMLAKSYSDTGAPQVTINEDRLASLSAEPEELFGLSEARRKQLFRDIAGAEDRATREAMARVPDTEIMKQIELEQQLSEKYKSEMAAKYGVTLEQLTKIALEGVKKGWPAN